jgi:hypothetical protein
MNTPLNEIVEKSKMFDREYLVICITVMGLNMILNI